MQKRKSAPTRKQFATFEARLLDFSGMNNAAETFRRITLKVLYA